jgi:hypothetical protein
MVVAGSDRDAKTVGGDTGGPVRGVGELTEIKRNRVTVGVAEGVIAKVGDGAESCAQSRADAECFRQGGARRDRDGRRENGEISVKGEVRM